MQDIHICLKEFECHLGHSNWHCIFGVSDDHLAREKVGQSLREQLHSQYKSSQKAKRQRKKLELKKQAEEFEQTFSSLDAMVQSTPSIYQNMQAVQSLSCNLGDELSDDLLLELFEQNNANILQTISSNDSNLQQGILQLKTFSC